MSGSIKDNPFLKNQFKKKDETPVNSAKSATSASFGSSLVKSNTKEGETIKETMNPAPTVEKSESSINSEIGRKISGELKLGDINKIEKKLVEDKIEARNPEPVVEAKVQTGPIENEAKEDIIPPKSDLRILENLNHSQLPAPEVKKEEKPLPEDQELKTEEKIQAATPSKAKDEKVHVPIIIINSNQTENFQPASEKEPDQFDSLLIKGSTEEGKRIADSRLSKITEMADEERIEENSFHEEDLNIGEHNKIITPPNIRNEEDPVNIVDDEQLQSKTRGSISFKKDFEKGINTKNGDHEAKSMTDFNEVNGTTSIQKEEKTPNKPKAMPNDSSLSKENDKREENSKSKLSPENKLKQSPEIKSNENKSKTDSSEKKVGSDKLKNESLEKKKKIESPEKLNESSEKNKKTESAEKVEEGKNMNSSKKSPELKKSASPGLQKGKKKFVLEKDLFDNLTMKSSNFNTEHHETEGDFHTRTSPNYQNTFMNMSMTLSSPRSVKECNLTVQRLYESLIRTEEKKSKLREEIINQEKKAVHSKTQISKGSKKLIKKNGLDEQGPIFDRTKTILEKTKEKNLRLKEEIEKKKVETYVEPTFQPVLVAKTKKHVKARTLVEFNDFQMKWKQATEQEILRTRYENLTKNLADVSFKPTINENSKKITECKNKTGEPVEKRLLETFEESKKKKQKIIEEMQPSFKPALNPKTQEIIKKKNQRKKDGEIKSLDLRHYQEEFLSKEIFYKPPSSNAKKDTSKISSKITAAPSNVEANNSLIIHKGLTNIPPLFDNINWGDGSQDKVNEINYSSNMDFILNKINGN